MDTVIRPSRSADPWPSYRRPSDDEVFAVGRKLFAFYARAARQFPAGIYCAGAEFFCYLWEKPKRKQRKAHRLRDFPHAHLTLRDLRATWRYLRGWRSVDRLLVSSGQSEHLFVFSEAKYGKTDRQSNLRDQR